MNSSSSSRLMMAAVRRETTRASEHTQSSTQTAPRQSDAVPWRTDPRRHSSIQWHRRAAAFGRQIWRRRICTALTRTFFLTTAGSRRDVRVIVAAARHIAGAAAQWPASLLLLLRRLLLRRCRGPVDCDATADIIRAVSQITRRHTATPAPTTTEHRLTYLTHGAARRRLCTLCTVQMRARAGSPNYNTEMTICSNTRFLM